MGKNIEDIYKMRNATELEEIFIPIKNYEGLYEISNFGRVKSLAKEWITGINTLRRKGETILKTSISTQFPMVTLCSDGTKKNIPIHLLVWDHFGEEERNGNILEVYHLDGNRYNPHINNLVLMTSRECTTEGFLKKKTSSKYTGVSYHKSSKKWGAVIEINRKDTHLGLFENEIDAKKAYQKALNQFKNTGKIIVSTPHSKRKSSKYIGVHWNTFRERWIAQTDIGGKRKWIGSFKSEYKAHLAYQKALRKII